MVAGVGFRADETTARWRCPTCRSRAGGGQHLAVRWRSCDGDASHGGGARDHDDTSVAAFAHAREAGLDRAEAAGEVDVDVLLPLLGRRGEVPRLAVTHELGVHADRVGDDRQTGRHVLKHL